MSATPTEPHWLPLRDRPNPGRRSTRSAAGLGLWCILMVALLAAGCSRGAPAPGPGAPPTVTPPNVTPGAPPASETPAAAGAPTPTGETIAALPAGLEAIAASPLLPGVELQLQAAFLAGPPGEAPLFRSEAWPALSAEQAEQLAARLGIRGALYQSPSFPPGEAGYLVAGETSSLEARSTGQWLYQAGPPFPSPLPAVEPPAPEQVARLVLQLQTAGLLDFSYQTQPDPTLLGQAQLVQSAANAPLIFESGGPAGVETLFGPNGQPGQIDYHPLKLTEAGRYPIISDREAWARLTGEAQPERIILQESWPGANRLWQRHHPSGERAELFGRLQIFQPVDPAAAPLVRLQGIPLAGDLGALLTANAGQLWQVWGQMEAGEAGGQRLAVESWQAAAFPEASLTGRVERQAEQVYLLTGNQRVLLPDAPADLLEGMVVTAGGVMVDGESPRIEWGSLAADAFQARGGPGFQSLSVGGQAAYAEPAPPPSPVQPGDRVEGETAALTVIVHQYADGQRQEVNLAMEASQVRPESLLVSVEAPTPPGVSALHRLPVRVWGEFITVNGSLPVLRVDQIEPLYPGMQAQAWLGLLEAVELDGMSVLQFTAQDGQEYVLGATPVTGDLGPLPGAAGEAVIIEGYAPPDQSYAGLPVLSALLIAPAQGRTDLEGYLPQSLAPLVVQEAGSAAPRRLAYIESIDLVYAAPDRRYASQGAGAPPAFAQPAWRFSGYYDDGTHFTILVQALKETVIP